MTTEAKNYTVWVGGVAVAENVTRADAERIGIGYEVVGYDDVQIEHNNVDSLGLAEFMGWLS